MFERWYYYSMLFCLAGSVWDAGTFVTPSYREAFVERICGIIKPTRCNSTYFCFYWQLAKIVYISDKSDTEKENRTDLNRKKNIGLDACYLNDNVFSIKPIYGLHFIKCNVANLSTFDIIWQKSVLMGKFRILKYVFYRRSIISFITDHISCLAAMVNNDKKHPRHYKQQF